MTCNDCLHFEVCDSGRHIGEYIEDDGIYSDGVEKQCSTFKNKADYVKVVRCEDCKCCEKCYPAKAIGEKATVGWYCKIRRKHMRPDDFCSYGERRIDNAL